MGKNVYMLYGMTDFDLDEKFLSTKKDSNNLKPKLRHKYESLYENINMLIPIVESLGNRKDNYKLTKDDKQEAILRSILHFPIETICINSNLVASRIEDFRRNTYTFKNNINLTSQISSWEETFKVLALYEYLSKSDLKLSSNTFKSHLASNFYFHSKFELFEVGKYENYCKNQRLKIIQYVAAISNSISYTSNEEFFLDIKSLVEVSKEFAKIDFHCYLQSKLFRWASTRLREVINYLHNIKK